MTRDRFDELGLWRGQTVWVATAAASACSRANPAQRWRSKSAATPWPTPTQSVARP